MDGPPWSTIEQVGSAMKHAIKKQTLHKRPAQACVLVKDAKIAVVIICTTMRTGGSNTICFKPRRQCTWRITEAMHCHLSNKCKELKI